MSGFLKRRRRREAAEGEGKPLLLMEVRGPGKQMCLQIFHTRSVDMHHYSVYALVSSPKL